MADDVAIQGTTAEYLPASLIVEGPEVAANVKRQRVMTAGFFRQSSNFNIPSATQYAVGDLVANSATAASVVPLSWTVADTFNTTQSKAGFAIRRAKLKKTSTSVTSTAFRLHLYGTDPSASSGILNGDNGAFSVNDATYLGWIDFPSMIAMRNGAVMVSTPAAGAEIAHAGVTTIYGLLEARGTYTPTNGETVTVELENWRL